MKFHVVLVEPEIPPNTGNIARTCAATESVLHLVKPLGFSTSDRYLKRAGLDYWEYVDVIYHDSLDEVIETNEGADFYFCSTKAGKSYTDFKYRDNSFFVFGKETKGLDEDFLKKNYDRCIRIPMTENVRSLNLANSVAVIIYEAARQTGFGRLGIKGELK